MSVRAHTHTQKILTHTQKRDFSLVGFISSSAVFLVAQTAKNLPAMPETWVRSLGQEDPLKKGMATHSNILAWEIPWTEEPGRLQSMGSQESDTTKHAHTLSSKKGAQVF